MDKHLFSLFAIAACWLVAGPIYATGAEVQAAIDLLKQSHADQCQKKKIQVQLLIAHQHHDQDKLNALAPELDAINKRLKPLDDRLNVLKATIKKNPDDASALETAQLELGNCEQ